MVNGQTFKEVRRDKAVEGCVDGVRRSRRDECSMGHKYQRGRVWTNSLFSHLPHPYSQAEEGTNITNAIFLQRCSQTLWVTPTLCVYRCYESASGVLCFYILAYICALAIYRKKVGPNIIKDYC